jgi:hypothetical protein
MDLPAGPLTTEGEKTVEIIGGMLRGLVRTDMTRLQTVSNRQQIHTHTCERDRHTLITPEPIGKGGKPLRPQGTPQIHSTNQKVSIRFEPRNRAVILTT